MPKLVHTIHVRIDGVIAKQTVPKERKQGGVAFLTGDATVWLPKSQLFSLEYDEGGDSEEIRVGQRVRTVEIPGWLAREKDLEEVDWD